MLSLPTWSLWFCWLTYSLMSLPTPSPSSNLFSFLFLPVHSDVQCAVRSPFSFSKFWLFSPVVSTAPEHRRLADPHPLPSWVMVPHNWLSIPTRLHVPSRTQRCHLCLNYCKSLFTSCHLHRRCCLLLNQGFSNGTTHQAAQSSPAPCCPLPRWTFMYTSGFFHLGEQRTHALFLSLTRNFHGLLMVHMIPRKGLAHP